MTMTKLGFKVGDTVKWSSQSPGQWVKEAQKGR